ncbi:MAG: hypothetical protein CSA35_08795 [Dethiosulfovibrio peptidovorans]|nr:MAG: hypothetical protein CSA35_08795 [Dethiosulfovibrio peptidovorans]
MQAESPTSIEQLTKILSNADDDTRLIAGGTDLVLYLRQHPALNFYLVNLMGIPELSIMKEEGDVLSIGATTLHAQLELSEIVYHHARALSLAAASVGSPQIRNRGTIGGNLAHASGAADTVPALSCLEARVVIEDVRGNTSLHPVCECIAGRNKTILRPDQYIRSFQVPLRPHGYSDFAKVGSRRAVTISKINLALSIDDPRNISSPVRLYVGAIAPSPTRSPEGEKEISALLRGSGNKRDFLDALSETVERTIPTRSSMKYKRTAIRGLGDDIWIRLEEVLL